MDEVGTTLAELRTQEKSFGRRLGEVEKRLDDLEELTACVKVLALRQERVESDVREIKGDVKELAAKPAQRWEHLIDRFLAALAGAAAAWIIGG